MNNEKFSQIKLISNCSVFITLLITPWFNKDSMVIGKQVSLVILCAYLLPMAISESKKLLKIIQGKLFVFILLSLLVQMALVVLISEAPIEQQFFGRTGRLLGFVTYLSFYVVLISVTNFISQSSLDYLLKAFGLCGIVVCAYSIFQSYNLDFFQWEKRTNSVIGTIGNPNYISALAASIALPVLYLTYNWNKSRFLSLAVITFSVYSIYRTESIQGYLALIVGLSCFTIYFLIFNKIKYLFVLIPLLIISFAIILNGALGRGPLSSFLYKPSVQSRGDFWRSAIATANDNPIFGVGIDSFGDYFLMYRDGVAAGHSFAEYTDSAHNFILDFAAQGGYIFAFLNLMIIIFTLYSFIVYNVINRKFDFKIIALFSAWLSLQSTFFVSPISIPLMLWSMVFAGAINGIFLRQINQSKLVVESKNSYSFTQFMSLVLILMTTAVMFPSFNTDRLYLKSLQNNDGNLGIKVVDMFPRSSARYSTVGRLLFESGGSQLPYSLTVAKKALEFNSNNVSAWALILVNPIATPNERLRAKKEILRLDPYNKEIKSYEIQLD